jgi:SAM-dependent methyltransferase
MLEEASARLAGEPRVTVVDHDLRRPLPDLGDFDLIISGFAIHHLSDERKVSIYGEIFSMLQPGGLFCNLEHVASPTARLHEAFCRALGMSPNDDDPSNQCVDVDVQLSWLRDVGFDDVDCYWKWRELALLAGHKPM